MSGLSPVEVDFNGRSDPFDFTGASRGFGGVDDWKRYTPLNSYSAVYNYAADGMTGYVRVMSLTLMKLLNPKVTISVPS